MIMGLRLKLLISLIDKKKLTKMEPPTVKGENPKKVEDFKGSQICLRCYERPALNDGSEEGFYFCERCIKERAKINFNNYTEKKKLFNPWDEKKE